MFALFLHDDAVADLDTLWLTDFDVAKRITVLLEELKGNQGLLDRLTQHKYGANRSADFDVSKWQEQWHKGRNLWRLKIWDLEDTGLRYRVIYAFDPKKHHYYILAVAPRSFNYAEAHPLTVRIRRAYEEL
ncbi:MAG: hypothetical protein U5S82_00455 [Gammaproteobacteria bacterium]|nr:hypothetical protein [Gammaproteobacteria bacterium]